MGYTNVFSMAGGWRAWKEADGEIEPSGIILDRAR
jgi:3-mercaptopyruvate sulfurtransferase SseA